MVNSQVAVYNRATLGLASQIDLDNFVGRPTNFHCDPQVLWDQQASRWFYAALDCDGGSQNFLVFGWSKTASPTPLPSSSDAGNWCRFAQATGSRHRRLPEARHEQRAHRDRKQRVPGQQLPHGQDLGIREAARGRSELRHAGRILLRVLRQPAAERRRRRRLHPRAGSGTPTAVRTRTWPRPTTRSSAPRTRSWSGT